MSRDRSVLAAVLVAAIAAFSAAPAAAGPSDPDPLSLLPGHGFTEAVGLGADTATVWICNSAIASENVQTFTVTDVVSWANTDAAPYFATISGGRYSLTFVDGGEFVLPAGYGSDPSGTCLDAADSRSTLTPNSMVITREAAGGGLGGGGTVYWNGVEYSGADLATVSSQTGRGFVVRGGSFLLPHIIAHEVGHTLHWPHSGSAVDPYDNQLDSMSGGSYVPFDPDWDNSCTFGPLIKGACQITHTMAINRYASGWIDADRVVPVARTGITTELVGPEVHTGDAFAIVPTADPLVYLTVEARPGVGYDSILPFSGVVVHRVDLTFACSQGPPFCVGAERKQEPAVAAADNAAHLVAIGGSLALPGTGVTVSVSAATASGFNVTFTGNPAGCAMGPNPFADVNPASYAFDSIGCIRTLGITTGTSATAYAPADAVNRAQMAAFLARFWRTFGNSCSSVQTPFGDIAGSFAAADIACIYDLEITTGSTPTTYSPGGFVNRAEMAAFLARLWRALGNSCSTAPTPFEDIAGSFAAADIACIYDLEITRGTTATTYDPASSVTREQMAAFLSRFWQAAI